MKVSSRMFFAVGEDQELMIHNTKDRGVIYELHDVVIDKNGNSKRKKKAADKETLWRMAFKVLVLDSFERRRKPHCVGLTEDEFVNMKHQEVLYGAFIKQSDEFFNGWMRQYSDNSEKKYRLLMSDFVLYLLDYHYDDFLLVDMEKIELYIANCIKRQRKEKIVLDTLAVLKNFAIEHRINFVRNDFEALREKIKEQLHINKVLYTASELTFFDWLFELLITKRDEEMEQINKFKAVLPAKKGSLGSFIASRRVRIRRIIYRMITDLFLSYSDMENLKIKDVHFEEKKLFIERKGFYIDLSDEIAQMLKEYLEFRDKYDAIIYEEKLVKGALLQSKIKLANDKSIEWEELLEKDVVDEIKQLLQFLTEREKKRNEATAAGEEYIEKGESDAEIYEMIYQLICRSAKRKEITKESYVEVDELFVSVNSRGLKSKGMREMISRFIRPDNKKYYEKKEEIQFFVFAKERLDAKERKKDEEYKIFMDQFSTVFFAEKREEKEKFINGLDESKADIEEEEGVTLDVEKESEIGYQDHNILKESAIAALKERKNLPIGEIEKKIRTAL